MSHAAFNWQDPFLLDSQLSDDERMVRDAAAAYARERLQPRVLEAFRHESFDAAWARERGIQGIHSQWVNADDTADMAGLARYAMEFCAIESCGKCTPCRIGSTRGVEVIDKIVAGEEREANFELLSDLCQTMTDGSLCAMGGLTPMPVLSAIKHFPEDFDKPAALAAE